MDIRSVAKPPSAFGETDRTQADAWDRWAAGLPAIHLPPGPTLVLAPHPDDETFGCGGLIARLSARSVEVTVVTVTDGAASHPGHHDLADRRRVEQQDALQALGCRERPVWLGLPDGDTDHVGRVLAGHLDELVRTAALVVVPWSGDGHPDHEVVGRIGAALADVHATRVVAYPVWAWRWGDPGTLSHLHAARLPLGHRAAGAKRNAMTCFPTQTTSLLGDTIVDAAMLDRFSRPFEVYLDA